MDVNSILDYLAQYGVIFIFVIVFLEYLNLPGLPAGIIMPLAGLWISRISKTEGLHRWKVKVFKG